MLHFHFIPRKKEKREPFRSNQCGTQTIKQLMQRFASGASSEQDHQNDCFDLPDFMMPQNLDLVDIASFRESNFKAYQAFVNAVKARQNASQVKPQETEVKPQETESK